jgi:hypothetical protein
MTASLAPGDLERLIEQGDALKMRETLVDMPSCEVMVDFMQTHADMVLIHNYVQKRLLLDEEWRIVVADTDVPLDLLNRSSARRSLIQFFAQASLYLNVFHLVVIAFRPEWARWCQQAMQASLNPGTLLELPFAVQPLRAREGQLAHLAFGSASPRRRAAHFRPAHDDTGFVYHVFTDFTQRPALVSSAELRHRIMTAVVPYYRAPAVHPYGHHDAQTLGTPFWEVYRRARALLEMEKNVGDVEFRTAHARNIYISKPVRDVEPFFLSEAARLGGASVTEASQRQAVQALKWQFYEMLALIDETRHRGHEERAGPHALRPQDEIMAEAYGRPIDGDNPIALSPLTGQVIAASPSYKVDLDAERWAITALIACHMGNVPLDQLYHLAPGGRRLGAAVASSPGGGNRAQSAVAAEHSIQEQRSLLRQERVRLDHLWHFVYHHSLAQIDLEVLAAKADQFSDEERTLYVGVLSRAPWTRGVGLRSGRRGWQGRLRQMLAGRRANGRAAPDVASLRALIEQRLAARDLLETRMAFPLDAPAGDADGSVDRGYAAHEQLDGSVQRMRMQEAELLLQYAKEGALTFDEARREVARMYDLTVTGPAPGPPVPPGTAAPRKRPRPSHGGNGGNGGNGGKAEKRPKKRARTTETAGAKKSAPS